MNFYLLNKLNEEFKNLTVFDITKINLNNFIELAMPSAILNSNLPHFYDEYNSMLCIIQIIINRSLKKCDCKSIGCLCAISSQHTGYV